LNRNARCGHYIGIRGAQKVTVMNNSTIFTANRATHVKIVVVSLIASIAVSMVGIAAHHTRTAESTARVQIANTVVKAGKPIKLGRGDLIALQ